MSKVLVELEVPKGCDDCPFYYETEGAFSNVCQHPNCDHFDCGDYGEYKDHRPDFCPFNSTITTQILGEPSQDEPRYCEYIPLNTKEEP